MMGLSIVYRWSYGLIILVCFIYASSCGAFGFMFIRYLWIRLSINILLFWKTTLFCGHYLRNRSTLDIGVLGYIGIL